LDDLSIDIFASHLTSTGGTFGATQIDTGVTAWRNAPAVFSSGFFWGWKTWENMGKLWENMGKHGKTMGKLWENPKNPWFKSV
jgi:hypothetical protein